MKALAMPWAMSAAGWCVADYVSSCCGIDRLGTADTNKGAIVVKHEKLGIIRFTTGGGGNRRPLMKVVARQETPTEPLEPTWQPQTLEDRHLG